MDLPIKTETDMKEDDLLLKATGLSLAYGHRIILEGVDMVVRPGEFWFILGINGTGKSTLLRAILGLLPPRAGRLWLDPDRAGRKSVGFVPQRCDLNPALPTTVREFVSLGLVGIQADRNEQAERMAWALGKVGLKGMSDRDYWSLSGGQRQRTLLARALVRRPQLLILDEPTNGVDLPAEEAFLKLLADLNREEKMTLLFVTHHLTLAARYATHIALFHHRHVQTGPVREILNPENLKQAYGIPVKVTWEPSPSVTILTGMERDPA
jgi:ABC-type Mn2+/Zn2+ transport system ATPase subunit